MSGLRVIRPEKHPSDLPGKQGLSALSTTSFNPKSQCWPALGGERKNVLFFWWIEWIMMVQKTIKFRWSSRCCNKSLPHNRNLLVLLYCDQDWWVAPEFFGSTRLCCNYGESWRKERWARLCLSLRSHLLFMPLHIPSCSSHAGGILRYVAGAFSARPCGRKHASSWCVRFHSMWRFYLATLLIELPNHLSLFPVCYSA